MNRNPASSGNVSSDDASRIVHYSMEEQFQLSDSLPASLKLLIQQAPVNMDPREVHEVLKKFGEQRGREIIEQVLKTSYPGWDYLNRKHGGRNA